MNVSTFRNLKTSEVQAIDTIDGVLDKIKNGYTKNLVLKARAYGRGTPSYNDVKCQIECFTPTGTFAQKRLDKNIIDFSGYVYMDVDESSNQKIFAKASFVYSSWSSLSNEGIGALAKVNNLNSTNFKAVWLYLEDYFKKQGVAIDPQTKNISRLNVISYDPSIWINRSCTSLDANQIYRTYSTTTTVSHPISYVSSPSGSSTPNYNSSVASTNVDFTKDDDMIILLDGIKYYTTLDSYDDKDYVVIPEGKDYRRAYVPKIIRDGERHLWLKRYIKSILILNPTISCKQLENEILKINRYRCQPQLSTKEVILLAKWYYNLLLTGSLDEVEMIQKKIWINPKAKLSIKEKRSIIGRETGALRRQRTLKTIQYSYDTLKLTHETVTQKMVEKHIGKSIRTIKVYWNAINK